MERLTRYTRSAASADAHSLSVLHRAGLRDLADVLVWAEQYDYGDDQRLVAQVAKHAGLFALVNGLRMAGFSVPEAVRLIVLDSCRFPEVVGTCYAVGVNIHDASVERIVHVVYNFLNDLDRRSW